MSSQPGITKFFDYSSRSEIYKDGIRRAEERALWAVRRSRKSLRRLEFLRTVRDKNKKLSKAEKYVLRVTRGGGDRRFKDWLAGRPIDNYIISNE